MPPVLACRYIIPISQVDLEKLSCRVLLMCVCLLLCRHHSPKMNGCVIGLSPDPFDCELWIPDMAVQL